MVSLFVRNFIFTVLQPGIVAGFIPWWILGNDRFTPYNSHLQFIHYLAIAVFLSGLLIMLECITRFATHGKGTLSPADPTKQLVTSGLYRYTRNPMYVGVMLILIGEALFFRTTALWIYSAGIFLLFHLFIIFREEPRLERAFGKAYTNYCEKVGRWI